MSATKSKGAIALSKKSGTARELAEQLGDATSPNTISQWCSGRRVPGKRRRQEIETRWPDITADLWDQFPTAPAVFVGAEQLIESAMAGVSNASPETTRDLADRVMHHAMGLERELAQQIAKGDTVSALRAIDTLSGVAVKLGKITGVSLTEREVLESPPLQSVISKLLAALESWPEAMRAAAKVLSPEVGE